MAMNVSNSVPRVSVILPVYNGEMFIQRAIDSMLAQTFRDFELIVLNDGSIDGTKAILDAQKDPRIRIVHKQNEGIAKTLNKGIELASGEYIARMDADDESSPERLERQIAYMDTHSDIAVLGTALEIIYKNRKQIRYFPETHEQVLRHIVKINPIAHMSTIVRKKVLEDVGGYNIAYDCSLGLGSGEDYHLWVKIIANGYKLSNLSEPLMTIYRHAESITGNRGLVFKLWERLRIRLWIKKKLGIGVKAYRDIFFVLILTILNSYGLNLDRFINKLSRQIN